MATFVDPEGFPNPFFSENFRDREPQEKIEAVEVKDQLLISEDYLKCSIGYDDQSLEKSENIDDVLNKISSFDLRRHFENESLKVTCEKMCNRSQQQLLEETCSPKLHLEAFPPNLPDMASKQSKVSRFKVPNIFQVTDSTICDDSSPNSFNEVIEHTRVPYDQYSVKKKKKQRDPKVQKTIKSITVSSWQEFYFGESVLDTRTDKPGVVTISSKLYNLMGGFIPKHILDLLVYTVFILMYFVSCLVYNMVWKLISYYLLKKHLRIHEVADQRKLKIRFTGNCFEGPYYTFVKQIWCAHCSQRFTEKITLNLMKTYRQECCKM